ncbi:SIN3 associated polypeptide P18, partial [Prunus dulcis]
YKFYYINPKSQNSNPKTRNNSRTKKLREGLQQWRGETETTRWADRVPRTKPRPEVHPADPSLLLLTLGVHRPLPLPASSPSTVKRLALCCFGFSLRLEVIIIMRILQSEARNPKMRSNLYMERRDTSRVKEIAPEARRRNAKLSFAFVYPDRRGHFVVKTVGMTHSYGNGRNPDENKALNDFNFQIGDYLDVAVL